MLGGVSGAQLVLHAGQCRRTSSAVVSTASRPRTLRLSAARRPVVSAAVPWATVPICALWGSPAGTFLPDLIVSVPRCGDVSLRPLVLQVLPPPRDGLLRRVLVVACSVMRLPVFLCGDGFPRPSILPALPPRNGVLRRKLLVAFSDVLLPVFLCGDGFLHPSLPPAMPPRNGLLRRVLLVVLV